MLKLVKTVAGAIACSLVSWSSAVACAGGTELGAVRHWSTGFSVYKQINHDAPLDHFTNIDIVDVVFEPTDDKSYPEMSYARFEVVRSLKGKSKKSFYYEGFRKDYNNLQTLKGSKIVNGLGNKIEKVKVREYSWRDTGIIANNKGRLHNTRTLKNLQFYDTFMLYPPRINGARSLQLRSSGECPPGNAIAELSKTSRYIVFRINDYVSHIEPVWDERDPLEKIISELVETGESEALEVSFKDFLKIMPNHKVIQISECKSFDQRNKDISEQSKTIADFRSKYGQYKRKPHETIDILYSRYNDPHKISYRNLKNYYHHTKTYEFACNPGEMFLAIKSNLSNPKHIYPIYLDDREISTWRFMRIEDDEIYVEDLITNLKITGPKKVPLSSALF